MYIASTGEGAILELSYPGMQTVRKHMLFTRENHINSLAPTGNGTTLWVMLHNHGKVCVFPSGDSLLCKLLLNCFSLNLPVCGQIEKLPETQVVPLSAGKGVHQRAVLLCRVT